MSGARRRAGLRGEHLALSVVTRSDLTLVSAMARRKNVSAAFALRRSEK